MNEQILLSAFLSDLDYPDYWWQIGALLLCLIGAKLFERYVRGRQDKTSHSLSQGGVKRLAFPLTGLLLVEAARALLHVAHHPVNLLSIAIPLLLSMAIIRMLFFVLRHTFVSSAWLAGFERGFALLVWGVVAMHIVGVLPQMIQFMEGITFTTGKQKLNLWLIAQGAATVVVTLLLALWLGGLVEARLARTEGLDQNLRVVFSRLSKALLVILAVLIGLPLVGIDLTTLSVFGGAVGVGLGFGLQKIASNYVSGFIILLDHSIQLGNVISVGNERGQVTRITTRYTVLKGMTGIEAIVPNEILISSVVMNESLSSSQVRVSLPFQVGYATDLEKAMTIMVDAARAQRRVLADPPPQAFVLAFADSGINLELGLWIDDPQQGTYQIRSDINLAIWSAFKEAGIEIPFPQRVVRLTGTQPAASDVTIGGVANRVKSPS